MPSQVARHLKPTVAANIKHARAQAGLTQAELARRVERDVINVSRWERGRVMPSLESLIALASVLGVSVEWFYAARDVQEPAA